MRTSKTCPACVWYTSGIVKGRENMNTVLKYPGAKNRLANWLLEYVPEHKIYVEPYFGSGALFFNKKPVYLETINDIDGDVVNFFTVLRDRPDELISAITMTPYAREEYERAYKRNTADGGLEKARQFAVRCWQGFGCGNNYKNGFRRGISENAPNPAVAWSNLPPTLQEATMRLKRTQIENRPALDLIRQLSGQDVFIYLDPPYVLEQRKQYLYRYEMSDLEHEELLAEIAEKEVKVLISGYDNKMYNSYLCDWNKAIKKNRVENGQSRTEVIWYNYNLSQQLTLDI